jgi:hypothetical protein
MRISRIGHSSRSGGYAGYCSFRLANTAATLLRKQSVQRAYPRVRVRGSLRSSVSVSYVWPNHQVTQVSSQCLHHRTVRVHFLWCDANGLSELTAFLTRMSMAVFHLTLVLGVFDHDMHLENETVSQRIICQFQAILMHWSICSLMTNAIYVVVSLYLVRRNLIPPSLSIVSMRKTLRCSLSFATCP